MIRNAQGMMTPRANHTPLSPQSFLSRSARVYPEKVAIHHGARRITYRQFFERACRFANGLREFGVTQGSKVAVLAPNVPALLEANYGVHMAGGALVAINTRLNPQEIAYIVKHSRARVLLVDAEYLPQAAEAWASPERPERLILIEDESFPTPPLPEGAVTYEAFLAGASPQYPDIFPEDEHQVIGVHYTSGTTGKPKGVMMSHRHAYLNAVGNLLHTRMRADSVYLWTLPIFHVSGWCFAWTVTAIGAAHVCLRKLTPRAVVEQILAHRVTHLCGAPIVLQMIAEGAAEAGVERFAHGLQVCTAAAPPSPSIIARMLALNVEVIHLYGLTETGPSIVCEIQPGWPELPLEQRARLMARQGVPGPLAGELEVLDRDMRPVPRDGVTVGEVCMRGNAVMRGYDHDPAATAEVFRGGWFHSGDLGVMHPDEYIELRDRAKDIIISGGENISTIEVENVLSAHPAVKDVAVVARPDDRWGEVPVAFVSRNGDGPCSEEELIGFCRQRLASFKVPKQVIFEELPRTSTGKIQKFLLRERFWAGREKRIN